MRSILFSLLALITFYASAATNEHSQQHATATFAGGCFWCMEPPFDKLEGVISTTSGYMGGHLHNPTYKQVSRGNTGHTEVLQVIYDPMKISYEKLLKTFWHNIDPTDSRGQFCDKGSPYLTGIFYHNAEQEQLARQSKNTLKKNKPFGNAIVTPVIAATTFYPAEEYHQDYYRKNPLRYKYYRFSCGRDARLQELWGD